MMRTLIGTTALVFLAAMSTTASADSYHYTANGRIGGSSSYEVFSLSATITDTIVDQSQSSGVTRVHFESSDVVFQYNEEEFNVADFNYGQVHRLDNGVSTYRSYVNFNILTDAGGLFAYAAFGCDFDYFDPEILRTYSDLTGDGLFQHGGWIPIHNVSSSLVPIPGVGALAPLAGIAAIRRRRRR